MFRVYGWTDDYVELKGESSFPEPRDLRQVAYDVGIQLGQAHPKDTSGRSPAREARMRLLEATCAYEGRVHQAIAELMERTVQAWRVFRTEAQPGDTGPPARSDGRGNTARYP